jgi:nicotinamidase-related amidase
MPISQLDPNTALIVIDLQEGIVAMAGERAPAVIANAARLAEAFRRRALPVVLVNVVPAPPLRAEQMRSLPVLPPGWTDLVPGLKAQPSDHRVTKHRWGAFTGTGLEDWLKARGITQVLMTGISTSIGVETTARQAYETGFNIAFAIDAMTDLNSEAHTNSITRIFPRLGETDTTDAVVRILGGEA